MNNATECDKKQINKRLNVLFVDKALDKTRDSCRVILANKMLKYLVNQLEMPPARTTDACQQQIRIRQTTKIPVEAEPSEKTIQRISIDCFHRLFLPGCRGARVSRRNRVSGREQARNQSRRTGLRCANMWKLTDEHP